MKNLREQLNDFTIEQQYIFASMAETYRLYAKVFDMPESDAMLVCERTYDRHKESPKLKTVNAVMATTTRVATILIQEELNKYSFSKDRDNSFTFKRIVI